MCEAQYKNDTPYCIVIEIKIEFYDCQSEVKNISLEYQLTTLCNFEKSQI